jgi:hypothetical protein
MFRTNLITAAFVAVFWKYCVVTPCISSPNESVHSGGEYVSYQDKRTGTRFIEDDYGDMVTMDRKMKYRFSVIRKGGI